LNQLSKNKGRDVMINAPSTLDDKQLEELSIQVQKIES